MRRIDQWRTQLADVANSLGLRLLCFLGAFTGSWLARRLALPNNSVRTLVGCESAASISASFNTPLAAVVLKIEVVMMEYTIPGFAPIILAAVTGSLVTLDLPSVHPHLMASQRRSMQPNFRSSR